MKVLQINSVCGIGSTGRIATDIHNILLEQGHESFIAFGRDIPINCETSIKIGTKYDNYAHVALTRMRDRHGFGSKNATNEFINKLKELNPDVIHLHNIHGYYINIEILFNYLKTLNKPVIWTLHDCWAFTGHCSYFDYAECSKWVDGCFDCPERKSYPASLFIDNSKENFIRKKNIFTGVENLTIVTPSKWLARLVKKSYLKEYPVEVINNGIDLNVFKPTNKGFRKKYGLENKYIILGVASTWDRRKGFKYFLELSQSLESDESIVMVGLTEKQIEQLPVNIIGITRTNNIKELVEIYSSADVFINPTLEDNFPTTNLEALACGTPVITFDTGGSIECVDTSCGKIINKGDTKSLIKAIKEVRNLDEKNCRQKSLNYDKFVQFQKYIDLYNNTGNKYKSLESH